MQTSLLRSRSASVWIKISLLNLLVVALFGTVMRYKIGFEFPYFNQKYLLHAHSHFAFAGWVTHTLMTLMAFQVSANRLLKPYRNIIIVNLISAWGMLISFSLQGYGAISITFSTLSIITGWFFAVHFLTDLKNKFPGHPSRPWFSAALIFNVISSAGTFYLAWMMLNDNFNMNLYLGSVYYYLHFQYNGWFFFSMMGLFVIWIKNHNPEFNFHRKSFIFFALSCVPAYFLSVIWVGFSYWILLIIAGAAMLQVIAWYYFLTDIKKIQQSIRMNTDRLSQLLLIFITLCITVKLGLQLFSTIPAISKLAFGFRPIVIAYLHLVLLAIISVFLLTYMCISGYLDYNRFLKAGLIIFLSGVLMNELVLLAQGIGSFSYYVIPFTNEMLFVASLWILAGTMALWGSQGFRQGSRYLEESDLKSK